jgi:beta-N-acetylhexosaminidase
MQADLIVIGTIDAQMQNEQAILTKELLNLGTNTVTIALRTPNDLMVYPEAGTHICTYGIQPCSLSAQGRPPCGASNISRANCP